VHGTAPLEAIEIWRGETLVFSRSLLPSIEAGEPRRIRIAWEGARTTFRHRQVLWDGALRLDRGRIREAAGYHFDHPEEGVEVRGEREVSWRSRTSGDPDGVVLDIEAPAEAQIDFKSPMIDCAFRLGDLEVGPIVHHLGLVDCCVRATRLPHASPPRAATVEFQDDGIPAGVNAYYVRVIQLDGERAWSSPIFVEHAPDG